MQGYLEICQPTLSASLRPGAVRLFCKENGAECVRIYVRIRGTDWRVLVDHRDKFPIDDGTPVECPGEEEIREYRAVAFTGEEEVGQPSEIVTVVLPG